MTAAPTRSVTAGTAAATALLVAAAPTPAAAWWQLSAAGSTVDPVGPLVALLSLLAWTTAGWLLLTVAATAGGHLPGRAGRLLGALARRVAPAAARRTVEVTLGLTVAAGALSTSPALASPGPPTAPAGGPVAVSLDWAAAAPTSAQPVVVQPVVVQPGDTLWHLAEHDLVARGSAAPTAAEVAQAWPSWWAANRGVVGDDPDLLLPGTSLTPPGVPAAE